MTAPQTPLDLWHRPMARSALLFTNFFLIILAYYLVKPASRSLFLEHADAAQLPYVWTASALLLLALMPLYQWIVRRYSRVNVVIGSCLLIVALLVLFRALMLDPGLEVAVGFYILVDIFSVVLVEQFWSLTNSVYRSAEGRRWYGLIASGGLLGGLVGGLFANWLLTSTPVNTADLLLVAASFIALMIALTLLLARHGLYREHVQHTPLDALPAAVGRGWRALRGNRYLGLIALMLLLSQMAEPIVEYQFMSLVEVTYPQRELRTAYLSQFLSVLSGVALLVNLLVTPVIHRRLGAIAGLLVQPLLLGATALCFALQSRLAVAAAAKIADRGLSYSINRASRELLYVPVDPVTIYRAKAWIDMVGYRTFKIAGNAVILLLTQWLPWQLGVGQLSWVVLGFCGLWAWAVLSIRDDYHAINRAALVSTLPGARPATDLKRE
ncbi:MAG TPA: Npt1/Npt2 family nucleotide transporter [Nevskiales bacterium]|nr:Npt1/Npt2 family nucleotide transporter [Nevskiales bacterium]